MAIVVWTCVSTLPNILHYTFWLWFTGPDPFLQPVMAFEWLLCSVFWFSNGVPFQAAYAMHLFTNQYPHQEFWLRHHGGEASPILQMERRGCRWFAITSFFIKAIEMDSDWPRPGPLMLPIGTLLKVAAVIGMGVYLVRYGMTMRMTKFKHNSLRRSNEFRILRLRAQPCFSNSPVQCDIIHSTLDCPPSYRAVSHRWAPTGDEIQIILVDGAPFPVSTSIYDLLVELRRQRFSQLLWIDSICIDQANAEEKSRQVGLMREIFEEATSTIGWLGKSPGAAKAFELVRRIVTTEKMDQKELASLKSSPSSGWEELLSLLTDSWFERVWIIQEIAASTNTVLQSGNTTMIHWESFAKGLGRILTLGAGGDEDLSILTNEHLMNALIMENMRFQVDEIDRLALKDVLKLGSRFKATLSVDSVFALLGVSRERNAPLFHPNFRHSEVFTEEIFSRGGVAKDLLDILGSISEFADGLRETNPLQSRKTIRLMESIPKAKRSFREMVDGMHIILDRKKKSKDSPHHIKPDYTDKSTPEIVYTMVARELTRIGDAFAFLPYAGIGNSRNPSFENLPSWVPDWSADINVYILPQDFKPPMKEQNSKSADEAESNDKQQSSVSDGGFNLLHIKGRVVGKVVFANKLRDNLGKSRGNSLEVAKTDLELMVSNLNLALNAAKRISLSYNQSDDDLPDIFLHTLLAKSTDEVQEDASKKSVELLADAIQNDRKLLEQLKRSELEDGMSPDTSVPGRPSSMALEAMTIEYLMKRKV
ncbi:heterokaryon incompatibility protein-domain-containing protein [Colletotrichum godetiae]|uniref:Heterokaryon incompatibility protein-domain-containing protein n=1 Tax=Colletotrichum godetiae TaxID=1209918 RepID=A0AAJ0ABM0_9PEZI|nr:heterokaryon incompatibility protein-domain-containing protein [Colletotrichum godetiae]KAK1660103.1 heterokaryon incompatibility protein-domain-containing protein [Colletotrichum godetiae]